MQKAKSNYIICFALNGLLMISNTVYSQLLEDEFAFGESTSVLIIRNRIDKQ